MIDHEQIVSFMLRLKYSLNIQKPESLTCENIKLPDPKDKTIKFGFAPVCVTKGITTPAAVNAASAGMVFSIPALFILQYDFNVPLVVLGCIVGGVMGVAFVIPLRKQMIDFERLTYPGGVAVATILKSPGAGIRKAKLLVGGALISGTVHAIASVAGVSNWALGDLISAPSFLNLTFYISLMTVGVGFIAGRGGFFFIGDGVVIVIRIFVVTGAIIICIKGFLVV